MTEVKEKRSTIIVSGQVEPPRTSTASGFITVWGDSLAVVSRASVVSPMVVLSEPTNSGRITLEGLNRRLRGVVDASDDRTRTRAEESPRSTAE